MDERKRKEPPVAAGGIDRSQSIQRRHSNAQTLPQYPHYHNGYHSFWNPYWHPFYYFAPPIPARPRIPPSPALLPSNTILPVSQENNVIGNSQDNQSSKGDYVIERSCQPCSTLQEAYSELHSRHGGYLESNVRAIVTNGLRKATRYQTGTVRVHRCVCCGHAPNRPDLKCTMAAQIREYNPDHGECYFQVHIHRRQMMHNHDLTDSANEPLATIGMHPELLHLTQKYIAARESLLSMKPKTILSHIISVTENNNKELRHKLRKKVYREQVLDQIRGYLYRKKESYLKERIGVSTIRNNAALNGVLAYYEMVLPSGYYARSNYNSPLDIAEALGVEEDCMFIVNLTIGRVHDTYRQLVVKQTASELQKFDKRMESAFYATSPNSLYQLLTTAKKRPGTRHLSGDGSGGFVCNGGVVMMIGSFAVKLVRDTKSEVRSSYCPTCYLHAGAERLHPFQLTLFSLRDVCRTLFDIELMIDWGISDHADTFVSAFNYFHNNPSVCDPPNVRQCNDTKSVVSGHVLNGFPLVSQLSQDYETQDNGALKNQSDVSLNCYFHVMQAFSKNSSYVKLFKNRSLVNAKAGGAAYKQVQLIHYCKTAKQRQTAMTLVVHHWRTAFMETKAADRFEKEYCVYPYWNWNYAVTGVPGIYPINNPTESFNNVSKDLVSKNVAIPRFLVESVPNLLTDDSHHRNDACVTEVPKECSDIALSIAGFLTEGRDIIQYKAGYLCKLRHQIGVPLTIEQIHLMEAACEGNTAPFLCPLPSKKGGGTTSGDVAKRMVDATKLVCYVTRNADGNWIGDCENCYKKLGYDCPAANWVRSKQGQLDVKLENSRKVPVDQNGVPLSSVRRGNYKCSYTGGLAKRKKNRQIHPMVSHFPSYLASLEKSSIVNIVAYLCLLPVSKCETETMTQILQRQSREYLDTLLKDFISSPVATREKSAVYKNDISKS